jgi:hypothetical protein
MTIVACSKCESDFSREHQHYGKENCEIRNAEGVDAHKESPRG